MDLQSDRGRRVSVEELNTSRLLAHASQQAHQRKLDEMVIVDVDAHHYENEHLKDILPYMENDVLRHLSIAQTMKGGRGNLMPVQVGYQDMGGRVTRYPLRTTEKTEQTGHLRDVQLGQRWMDAMSVDYSCLFPTGMLNVGLHPQKEMEVAALRHVETFGDRKGVGGFMVTTVRNIPVHDNSLMKVYRAIEERGLVLSFHSAFNWNETIFKTCNRFLAVHALGFSFYNILHLTNWVTNGIPERFPKLPVIWIESGLAWVPFLMQRLDHEYMMRPSECPTLKKKPSDYMRDMYYSSQPMECQDREAMECTFRMINAETQLLYASDYPHWDFDLPSTIYDLPFLSEKAKHNILGGTAARLFKLPPRNEKQKENLIKHGNLSAAAA